MIGTATGQIGRGREESLRRLGEMEAASGGTMGSGTLRGAQANVLAGDLGRQVAARTDIGSRVMEMNRMAAERGAGLGQQAQQNLLQAYALPLGAQTQLANTAAGIYGAQLGQLPTYLQAQQFPSELQADIYRANVGAWPGIERARYTPAEITAGMYSPYLAQNAQLQNQVQKGLWDALFGGGFGLG